VDEYGPRLVKKMPLEAVYQCLSKNELFRLSWGAKNAHGDDWKKLQAEYEERLLMMIKSAEKENWLQPQGMYGYWPCQADGNDLIIYQPHLSVKINRWNLSAGVSGQSAVRTVPRRLLRLRSKAQKGCRRFQVWTVGQEAADRFDRLQQASAYSEAISPMDWPFKWPKLPRNTAPPCLESGLEPDQGNAFPGVIQPSGIADHAKLFSSCR
jgi:5-methyltetrahydrofolate--homocysteine methyltransferase